MHKGFENINLPLRGFVRRFYVSNLEEFSFCRKRQYSYNERNTLKLRWNCERNFDVAFSSSFEITFFWVRRTYTASVLGWSKRGWSVLNVCWYIPKFSRRAPFRMIECHLWYNTDIVWRAIRYMSKAIDNTWESRLLKSNKLDWVAYFSQLKYGRSSYSVAALGNATFATKKFNTPVFATQFFKVSLPLFTLCYKAGRSEALGTYPVNYC